MRFMIIAIGEYIYLLKLLGKNVKEHFHLNNTEQYSAKLVSGKLNIYTDGTFGPDGQTNNFQ